MQFSPDMPLESLDYYNGATWTQLRPFPNPDSDTLVLHGWAGIGAKFPVFKEDDVALFEVRLKDGDDDRVTIEIISTHGSKEIELQRDKAVKAEVENVEYEFRFPSVYVASTEKEKTTDKAMLLVSTRR